MSYQEKSVVASLISAFVIFGFYFVKMSELFQTGRFEAADASSLAGKMILLLIAGGIVVNIVMHILIAIIHAIITGEKEAESTLADERDKLIELKSITMSYYVFGAGFIVSVIALALGVTTIIVLNLIVVSLAIASIVEGIMRLFLYRRGF